MTYMLGDFVEKLRPIGRLDLLDDVGSKALSYLGKKDAKETSATSLANRIKALQVIAEVNGNRGRPKEAEQALQVARELVLSASKEFHQNSEFLKQAGFNSFMLGQQHYKRRELDKAELYFRDYEAYAKRYGTQSPDKVDGFMEQSYAASALGTLSMAHNDFEHAAKEFTSSLQLKQQALKLKPGDAKIMAELASSISWSAESTLKLGSIPAAMKLLREEEALLRSIPEPSTSINYKLALSLMRQSSLSAALGERVDAVRALQDAEKIAKGLTEKDPSNNQWQSRLLQSQGRLIELELSSANVSEKLAELDEILRKLSKLHDLDPTNTFLSYLAVKFKLVRTGYLVEAKRDTEALASTDLALAEMEPLYQKAKNDNVILGFFAEGLLIRADLTRNVSGEEAARSFCRRAAGLLQEVTTSTYDHILLASAVKASLCIGDGVSAKVNNAKLQRMGYRDSRYLNFISTHPLMKGKL
jgi:tetratricopeptide (TPR) repeat protein